MLDSSRMMEFLISRHDSLLVCEKSTPLIEKTRTFRGKAPVHWLKKIHFVNAKSSM